MWLFRYSIILIHKFIFFGICLLDLIVFNNTKNLHSEGFLTWSATCVETGFSTKNVLYDEDYQIVSTILLIEDFLKISTRAQSEKYLNLRDFSVLR